jgi:hypothetical protein
MSKIKKDLDCELCGVLMVNVAANRKFCDDCRKKKLKNYQKKYARTHKEIVNAKSKRWRDNHLDQMKSIKRNWEKRNPEKKKEYDANYRRNHPNKRKEYYMEHREEEIEYAKKNSKTLSQRYYMYKKNAKQRGIEFNISLDNFKNITNKTCVYCGGLDDYNGIDRKDNSIGYEFDNIQPCCTVCNMMKRHYTENEFLSHISKIYKYNKMG